MMDSGLLIKQLHDSLEKNANNVLRSKDITMMQLSTLIELNKTESHQMSMKEIEHQFRVAQSTVVGIVNRLEAKGMVETMGDKKDRRVKHVRITQKGIEVCRESLTHQTEAESKLLDGFTEEEKQQFVSYMERALHNINR